MGIPEDLVLAALFMLVLGSHKLGRGLGEGIQNFKDAMGGGPQPPTHPLPGNDSKFLIRRQSRPQSD